MKNLSLCLSFLALFALVGVAFAQDIEVADDSCSWKPDFDLTLDWQSRYVSKGKIVNPDPIASANVWIGLKGFYVNFWSPFDMTDINSPKKGGPYKNDRKYRPEEIDYQIGYAYTFDKDLLGGLSDLTIDFSWNYWQYPDLEDYAWGPRRYHDEPLALVVSLGNVLPDDCNFSLGLGTELDYDLQNYLWWGKVYADLGFTVPGLDDRLSLGLKNSWYWGGKSWNRANLSDEMNDWAVNTTELKFYASFSVTDNISLGAFWAAAWALNPSTREVWKTPGNSNHQPNCWGGVSIDFAF
ncbi:MAG: hypothetical protein IKR13_02575 [Victivallales bacterium]|nr:hypothetical protein [Victivallales bacterium]